MRTEGREEERQPWEWAGAAPGMATADGLEGQEARTSVVRPSEPGRQVPQGWGWTSLSPCVGRRVSESHCAHRGSSFPHGRQGGPRDLMMKWRREGRQSTERRRDGRRVFSVLPSKGLKNFLIPSES